MDKRGAIQLLPEPYGKALLLRENGFNEEEIAKELGIAAESVEPCLRLAEAKLANLLTDKTIVLTDHDLVSDSDGREPR